MTTFVESSRDSLNAARNLVNYYQWHAPLLQLLVDSSCSSVAVSYLETLNACGELVNPGPSGSNSMNQE
ncbi:MAG: hypothetical protein ACFE8U_03005 [Candidatus Hermodarchaeota archaeon]